LNFCSIVTARPIGAALATAATALVEEFGAGGFEPPWIEIGNLSKFCSKRAYA
jgi:hypothetical protein